jgi:hypothetical protein
MFLLARLFGCCDEGTIAQIGPLSRHAGRHAGMVSQHRTRIIEIPGSMRGIAPK